MKKLIILLSVFIFAFTAAPSSAQMLEKPKIVKVTTVHKSMEAVNSDVEFNGLKLLNGEGYMDLSYINDTTAFCFWLDSKLLKTKSIKKLNIYMSSWGGSYPAALSMISTIEDLKDSGITVKIEGLGIIASAGVFVFSSGSERIVSKNTIFMLHEVSLTDNVIKKSEVKKLFEVISIRVIEKYSDLSGDNVKKLMDEGAWMDAETAKKNGLVDIIR